MPNSLITPVSGTDGVVPIYDPTARWCWWEINEIYQGGPGSNRYIPKVGDYVVDKLTFTTQIVDSIDPVTLIATLRLLPSPVNSGVFTLDDILVGVGPGTQSDTYRVYVDTSVTPHILAVDARLKIGGSMASYAKIFKGSDVSSTGQVISRLYDQSGSMLSLNIPLELAAINSSVNYSIKVIAPCYTDETLNDGEVVTAVIYSDTGHVISKRQLLVENTAFIRSVNASQKYISHISLETPFLSSTTDTLIEFPINVPIEGLGFMGVVHYSDGSMLRMPVDGTKFKMLGLHQFVGTIVGQRVDLVLSYNVSPNETVYGAINNDGIHITKPYTLVSLAQDGAYAVKLFGYPVWIDAIQGYTMNWTLYTLDRNITYDVTQYVTYDINTGAFRPKAYGFLQNLSVSINLRNVSGAFKSYIHVQSIDIVLAQPGTARSTNWTIGFETNQTPPYGIDLFAKANMINSNLWKIKVDADITTQAEWLDRLYYNSKPLMNAQRELAPPTPNFFVVRTAAGGRTEFPISAWNSELTIDDILTINDTIYIEFIRRLATNDVQLAIAGLPIYEYM